MSTQQAWCPHDDDPQCCPVCLRGDGPVRQLLPRWRVAATFTATYNGRCHICHDPIDIGDPIALLVNVHAEGDRVWVHQRPCVDEVLHE